MIAEGQSSNSPFNMSSTSDQLWVCRQERGEVVTWEWDTAENRWAQEDYYSYSETT